MLLCTFFAYNCPLLEFTDSRSARERCNARLLCLLSLSCRALRLLLFLLRFFFFLFVWCCESGRAIARADPAHLSVQVLCFLFDSRRLIYCQEYRFLLSLSRRAFRCLVVFVGREIARGIESADPAYFSIGVLLFPFFTCAVSFTAGGRTPALLLSPSLALSSCLSFFLFLLRFFFFFVLRNRRGNCECGSGPFFFFPLKFVRFFYSSRAVSFTGGRT